jgi:hypothetical protein
LGERLPSIPPILWAFLGVLALWIILNKGIRQSHNEFNYPDAPPSFWLVLGMANLLASVCALHFLKS